MANKLDDSYDEYLAKIRPLMAVFQTTETVMFAMCLVTVPLVTFRAAELLLHPTKVKNKLNSHQRHLFYSLFFMVLFGTTAFVPSVVWGPSGFDWTTFPVAVRDDLGRYSPARAATLDYSCVQDPATNDSTSLTCVSPFMGASGNPQEERFCKLNVQQGAALMYTFFKVAYYVFLRVRASWALKDFDSKFLPAWYSFVNQQLKISLLASPAIALSATFGFVDSAIVAEGYCVQVSPLPLVMIGMTSDMAFAGGFLLLFSMPILKTLRKFDDTSGAVSRSRRLAKRNLVFGSMAMTITIGSMLTYAIAEGLIASNIGESPGLACTNQNCTLDSIEDFEDVLHSARVLSNGAVLRTVAHVLPSCDIVTSIYLTFVMTRIWVPSFLHNKKVLPVTGDVHGTEGRFKNKQQTSEVSRGLSEWPK